MTVDIRSAPADQSALRTSHLAPWPDLQAELSAILAPERVLTGPLERIAYASDASFYRLIPQAVVQPASVEEIRALFAFSHRCRLPLTFRAAGTSLSGQAVTDGILVDLSKHWGQVRIEDGGARVRVQPGAIGGFVNTLLKPFGRRIGPDPASIDTCMLGGILANNASGMCCGVVENAYHTLDALTCVLPSGLVLDSAAPGAREQLAQAAPALAEGLLDIRQRVLANASLRERIRAKYRMKNTMGYSLNAFLDFAAPLDILAHLLIGSEGTLGFIAEAVLHTLPDWPLKYTGLLSFANAQDAARAIVPLRDSGARALEIMDRAALRSIEDLAGAPPFLRDLPETASGLLVEYQCATSPEMAGFKEAAARLGARLPLLRTPEFTEDPLAQAALWKLRKGMFPAIGAMRPQGTTVIIEDVAFPIERLADAMTDLQALFRGHGYEEAIIFGHAKDGNLHFVITPSFNDDASVGRYARFIDDVVRLVVDRYDGALKAEHGTGRNMAPFVDREWGAAAYELMAALKALIDPEGLLNPGVIINPDPAAHLRHLKPLPAVAAEVDRCMECGFCEPHCPSRALTLTPRQRIVVRREMARLATAGEDPELAAALGQAYPYAGLDTCAVDGLCATACPVGIDTGAMVKRLRAEAHSERAQGQAHWVAEHFATVEGVVRAGVALGHVTARVTGAPAIVAVTRAAERVLGTHLPKWNPAVPHASARRLPVTERAGAQAVYFPACLSRAMGKPPFSGDAPSLIATMLTLAGRAGVALWIPPDCAGHCCGMPFSSKGYTRAYRATLHHTIERLWEWSGGGALPIVTDASSCAYTLRACAGDLEPEDRARWERLTLLECGEFIHDVLLPRLRPVRLPESVVLHPNCALRKLGAAGKLVSIAEACAASVTVPRHLDCCGFAGDRGLLFPELTRSATRLEAEEVCSADFAGYYSSNLTCEMGLALATGRPYRSIAYLVERATRRE